MRQSHQTTEHRPLVATRRTRHRRVQKMSNPISIDPEFQDLIVPLSTAEFELLRSQILAQGCLEPLYVWKTEDSRILLDGHNRYKICKENNRSYTVRNVAIPDRD